MAWAMANNNIKSKRDRRYNTQIKPGAYMGRQGAAGGAYGKPRCRGKPAIRGLWEAKGPPEQQVNWCTQGRHKDRWEARGPWEARELRVPSARLEPIPDRLDQPVLQGQ